MENETLQFPDAPRGELEKSIAELISKAQTVLGAQGRLRALLQAYRAVIEELDLERVLTRIVEASVELVGARYGALGVVDGSGLLEQFIHVGITPEEVHAIGHLPEGHGLLGAVIDTGESIRLAHLGQDPRSVGFPEHHPAMDAFLGVPIRVRDQVFGNLYLANPDHGTFTEEDQELIESLAGTAGIAIENARLYEQARRQERVAAAQSEVRAALLSPDSEDVLAIVADRVAAVVPVELVTVVVPEQDGAMRIEVARGASADRVENLVFPEDASPPARAMAGHTTITTHSWELPDGAGELGPTAAVPFTVGGRSVGVLCVSRRSGDTPFTDAELTAICDFAAQAALAISLAEAQRDRQRLEVIEDRSRIARDLHDNVIQRLFATGLGLQALAGALPDRAELIDGYVTEIDEAIVDIRTAIFTLRSRQNASPARQRLLDLVTEFAPALPAPPRLTFVGPVDLVLRGPLGADVLAVVRESLANVARHAHAQSASIQVEVTDHDVSVLVDDDGDGIDPGAERASGTANLHKRAVARGGTYAVQPGGSGGTSVVWRVPIDA